MEARRNLARGQATTFALLIVLTAGVAGSIVAGRYAASVRQDENRRSVGQRADGLAARLNQSTDSYGELVDVTAGFFAGSTNVERSEFAEFVERVDVTGRHPGMQGLGVIKAVGGSDRARFTAEARVDGAPAFEVSPAGDRSEYAIILFNEPAAALRPSWGFDVSTIPVANEALTRARDSGLPALTGRLVLAADRHLPKSEQPPAFALYAPIYRGGKVPSTVAGRRANLLGWTNAPFRTADFLDEVLGENRSGLAFSLYDGASIDQVNLIGTHMPEGSAAWRDASVERTLDVHGRTWTMHFSAAPTGASSPLTVGIGVGALGLLLTGLLVALLTVLHHSGRRELESSERHTQEILGATKGAFMSVDDQGRISAWNDKAAQLFGWSADEALGRALSRTIIPPEFRDRHDIGFRRLVESETPTSLDLRTEAVGMRRDGTTFPVEMVVWASIENGSVRVNSFVHDISERVGAQAELAAARDDALQASEVKSQFLANMSHELRTPMNGVLGMTAVLLDTELDDRQRDYTETIRGSGDALLAILNDILDLAKVEAGRVELDVSCFELHDAVRDLGLLLGAPAAAKGIDLSISIDSDVPTTVEGDVGRFRQILTNLVGNAVKFTDEGAVRIKVGATEGASSGFVDVLVEVHDTGIGIASKDLGVIFEPFAQAEPSTTRRFGGTGLGLAITRGLVELLGGTFGVESRIGEGSTFWFVVPLVRPMSQHSPHPEFPEPIPV